MQVKQLLPALFLCSSIFSYGQKQDYNQLPQFLNANKIWIFADSAGLDFRNGTPFFFKTLTPTGTFQRQNEGFSSVCDPLTGDLLFYTDGAQCWRSDGQIMPNGDSLMGSSGSLWIQNGAQPVFGTSTVQGTCVVPVIGAIGKYYLFSLNYEGHVGPAGSLFYNIVDMNMDNGKGDIVSGKKNILLDSTALSEAMIAIPGNNCDVWLLVHSVDTTTYKAYHITEAGIDPNSVLSYGKISPWVARLVVAPNRHYVSLAATAFFAPAGDGGLEICRFNPNTGMVSDSVQLVVGALASTSSAFSPDNSKLYANDWGSGFVTQDLVQFDVSNYNASAINASRKIISTSGVFGGLRLYNDTIYLLSTTPSGNMTISTINKPNDTGSACGYHEASITSPSLVYGETRPFCSEIVYPLPSDTIKRVVLDSFNCSWEDGITLHPTYSLLGYNYQWNNQTTDTLLKVKEEGSYWVSYTNGCHTYVDTFHLSASSMTQPVIRVDSFDLGTIGSYTTYQWLFNGNIIPGATDSTYTVTQNGNYRVAVSDENGCIDTSKAYKVTNITGTHDLAVISNQIKIYPNPARNFIHVTAPVKVNLSLCSIEGKILKQVKMSNEMSLQHLAEGIYFLQVYDQENRLIKTKKIIKTF